MHWKRTMQLYRPEDRIRIVHQVGAHSETNEGLRFDAKAGG
jgi:hypothetical protein